MDKRKIKNGFKKKKSIYSDLDSMISIGEAITLVGALPAFLYNKNQYLKLFGKDINEGILSIGLLISTMIWIVIYAYTVKNELNLLNDYFKAEKIPRYQVISWILGGVIAGLFFGLIWFSYYIYIYCILIICLQFFDIWGGTIISAYIYDEFTEEIQDVNKDAKEKDKLKIITGYYLKKAIFLRTSINLIIFFFSFILVVYYRITNNINLKYYAYIILIATILFSNFILHFWRKKRERSLHEE
ncbi:unnamed protein product [marine sediment metagenome]|uniref:Uncharacterized protein n=1 Tax=marine sediment metagenome TaxID=412755 RepID=X0ZC05_9ZZZZ